MSIELVQTVQSNNAVNQVVVQPTVTPVIDLSMIDTMKDDDIKEILKQIVNELVSLDNRVTTLESNATISVSPTV